MPTFTVQLQDGNKYDVEAPEGTTDAQAYQYALSQVPPATPELGLMDTFGGGVSRGLSRLGSTFTDIIPAMAGSAIGADEYAEEQFAEAAEKQRVSELFNPTQFASYKDVEGIGDFTRFVGETIGEQVGNLGLTIGTILTGGTAAPALLGGRALATKAVTEAAKKAAATTVAKQAATGQLAGAGFGSYALNAPEVFENIYRETGETAPGTALIFGAGAAALDSVLPAALARNISGPMKAGVVTKILERSGMKPGVLRSGTAGLFSGLGVEGITEGAQEGISIAAERFIDDNPDVFGSKEFDRIMEASVRGAVAGGGFGTVGGGVEGAREGAQRGQRLQDLKESRKLRDDLNKRIETYGANAEEAMDNYAAQFDTALSDIGQQAPQETTRPSPAEEFAQAPTFDPTGLQAEAEAGVALDQAVSAGIADQDAAIQTAVDRTQTTPSATPSDVELFIGDTTQFDAFGQPVEVTSDEVAAYTIPKVRQEAQRRARVNKTKVSEELKNVSQEVNAARDAVKAQKTKETKETTVIPTDREGLKNWGKNNFGIGHSAAVLRENGPLAGKDLSDPAQAAEVQATLTTVKDKSTSATIPGRIDEFLKRPEFVSETTERQTEPDVEGGLSDAEIAEQFTEINPTVSSTQETIRNQQAETLKSADTSTVSPVVPPADTSTVLPLNEQDLGKPIETFRGTLKGQEQTTFDVYETSDGFVTEIKRPSVVKGQPPAVSRTQHANKKQVEAAKNKIVDTLGVLKRTSSDTFKNKPTYQGKALNRAQRRIAERGNFKQLLSSLIKSQPKEIQQILRKIRSQGLATKLVIGATPQGTSGYYDAGTGTIVLNPQEGVFSGLTEHTFLHETGHASLAQALTNPDLQITKDFQQFFIEIKDQMGGMYGGNNLQEFAAELIGNPEFQALLKDTRAPKAPAGKNMWTNIMEAIARFFGFRPQQTAYDKGLDFIDKILDISQGVEPTLADRMFLGTPAVGVKAIAQVMNSGETLTGRKKEQVLNVLSKLRGTTSLDIAMRVFRLQDFKRLFGDKIPLIEKLQSVLLGRQGAIEKDTNAIQDNYRDFRKLVQDEKLKTQAQELNDIAQEATLDQYDLVGVDGKRFDPAKLTPEQRSRYNALQTRFNRLDPSLKGMYKKMRQDYLDSFYEYRDNAVNQIADGNKRRELLDDFEAQHPLVGYVPQIRFGEYVVEYTDTDGRTGLSSFETPRERTQFIENSGVTVTNTFDKLKNIPQSSIDNLPSNTFIAKLLKELPPEQRKEVYETHLSFFPDSAFVQRFRRRRKDAEGRGIVGASKDLTKVYGDTMLKWAKKKNNLKYLPEIEKALAGIDSAREAGATGLEAAVRAEIGKRADFMRNPHYRADTSFFATSAYNLFLTGNISAAIVNLSAITLLSSPLLAGQFGFGKANAALLKAMKIAHPFGKGKLNKDTGTIRNPDWVDAEEYRGLAEALDAVGQRQHTLQREITEGARQSTEEYTGLWPKIQSYLSIPFTEAEKYSRGVTAIAAYNLAKQQRPTGSQYKGMTNEEAAIEYAINMVTDVHTSGMAAEGPSLIQHPIGRVVFTFKTFIWNSAIITAFAMKQAGMFRPLGIQGAVDQQGNVDAEARRIARNQVIGIYGMSAAIAGVNGLPFFGATATLVNIINAILGDEDEPFNFRDETRLFVGELAFKGPINYRTNFEISNRVGLANGLLFREDPYSIEESGYIMTAVSQAMGPVGSYLLGAERALLEGGRKEMLLPSGARNLFKSYRFAVEGATNKDGQPIISDISRYNLAFQAFGFGPADLSNIYEVRSAALNFENKVDGRISKIKRKYIVAKDIGDVVGMIEAEREMTAMQRKHPDKIDKDTLKRSYRSTQSYRERVINGITLDDKLNNPYAEQLLLLD